jgi:hypothetical protein
MATNKSSGSSTPIIQLSISFSGPMFFDFSTNASRGRVEIHVPYCPYHEAAFFFQRHSYSESDLYACALKNHGGTASARCYSIDIGGLQLTPPSPLPIISAFPKGKPLATTTPIVTSSKEQSTRAPSTADSIYVLSIDGLKSQHSLNNFPTCLSKHLFQFSVPMPNYLSSLYTDKVQILPLSGKPTGTFQEHATALRFYYEWDGNSDIVLNAPNGLSRMITPPLYKELPSIGDIEIRYEGIDLEDDNDPHSDARSCFASLVALAGTDWWLNYGDGRTTPTSPVLPPSVPKPRDPCDNYDDGRLEYEAGRLEIKTGADCHAPIITTGLTI